MSKEKDMEGSLNLTGKLLAHVSLYEEINSKIKELDDQLKDLRKVIMTEMKKQDIKKAKSQLYSVALSHIKTQKLAQKKLKEILFANNLGHYYDQCLYDSEYDQLRVSKRKAGENIF